MQTICNTIHPDDYKEIQTEIALCEHTVKFIKSEGGRLEIPCYERWWEYGTAIKLALDLERERMGPLSILDVGSGWGAVGPTLSLYSKYSKSKVIEYEPDQGMYGADRDKVNLILQKAQRQTINIHGYNIFNMPMQDYDVVFCISVMEHIHPNLELQAWRELVTRVRPSGILFITTDCLPEKGKPYMFDELRAWNPTPDCFEQRVKMVEDMGMKVMGTPDYTYNGDFVHDQYSFFRVGFTKER
jgi:SAM-dependent methyltransferase